MRKLASVLCLLVLCATAASAQTWNLANDPNAVSTQRVSVSYDEVLSPLGLIPVLSKVGNTIDEVIIWRTGDGNVSQTLVSASKPSVQTHAAVLNGVANGFIARPAANVARTKVWFAMNGTTRSHNYEVRWGILGTSVTRLPDDIASGVIN